MDTLWGMSGRAVHWEGVYREKATDEVSWYQADPRPSLALVDALGIEPGAGGGVVDVGAGASPLLAALGRRGFTDLTAVDVSAAALDALAAGAAADDVQISCVTADVTAWDPGRTFGLWHDRAALHFLVDEDERAAYLDTLQRAVPDGAVVVATFATDGPEQCSGLPVRRYSADELLGLLDGFELVEARRQVHTTPWGAEQAFTWVAARRP